MTNVTCGLTAKKPGSAPSPTLVIKYGSTLLYFNVLQSFRCSVSRIKWVLLTLTFDLESYSRIFPLFIVVAAGTEVHWFVFPYDTRFYCVFVECGQAAQLGFPL